MGRSLKTVALEPRAMAATSTRRACAWASTGIVSTTCSKSEKCKGSEYTRTPGDTARRLAARVEPQRLVWKMSPRGAQPSRLRAGPAQRSAYSASREDQGTSHDEALPHPLPRTRSRKKE